MCYLTETRIEKFLECYRDNFPQATITPKIHMLEDHVVEFLKHWKAGLGFLGEQGAESIHARFNSIRRNYSNMPNRVQQLECIMKDHFNQVCPDNIIREPPAKKRAQLIHRHHTPPFLVVNKHHTPPNKQ